MRPTTIDPPPQPLMTGHSIAAAELLRWRRDRVGRGSSSDRAGFDWLLDLGGGLGWQQLQQLALHPERQVVLQRSLSELDSLWQRHQSEQIPLQYLLGQCPWRDLDLQVAPGVLIPRAETELLVDLALQRMPQPPALWADLGSGSGALAIALARAWPASRGLAVELSTQARTVAAANLQAAGVACQVQLLAGDWWQPLAPWWGQLALVVSNPPYIPTAVWSQLEPVVREHEPQLALDGGVDGLDAMRQITAGAAAALAPGGWLLLEHHCDQSAPVMRLLAAAGLEQAERHNDLEGQWRFASARRPHEVQP